MTEEKLAYSIRDAGDQINSGRTKVYQLIGEGKLDARSNGGRTIITAASLKSYVANLPPAPIKRVR